MSEGEDDADCDIDECVIDKPAESDNSSDINLSTKQLSIFNSVSLGLYHGLAVSRDKGVYTWGSIWHNAMGLGIENGEVKEPIKIPFFEDKSALQVSCGDAHSAVLVATDSNYLGTVYTFGLGNNGRLGYPKCGQSIDNDNDNANVFRDDQNEKSNGTIHTDIMDDKNNISSKNNPKKIQLNRKVSLEEVLQCDTSASHLNNQSWFSTRPFRVKLKLKVRLVSCGSAHTLVICEDSSLWSWGRGNFGVLGLGSNCDVFEPTKVALDNVTHVSAGDRHSLAVSNNSLYSWGYGANGRLGLYHSKNVYDPSLVNGKGFDQVLYVSAGQSHSACINCRGEIFTWGSGQGGRLGHSWSLNGDLNYPHQLRVEEVTFQSISCGMAHTIALSGDGKVYFWGTLTNQSNTPVPVPLGTKAISVNAGPCGVAVITSDGDLASWGIGGYYRLGHSNLEDYVDPSFVTALKGSVGLFKAKNIGFDPLNWSDCHVIDIECGESHVCALCNDGSVYSWGRALGSGATENFGSLKIPEKLIFKSKIDTISCGKNHCMALTVCGRVYSWGSNTYGQLGLGRSDVHACI